MHLNLELEKPLVFFDLETTGLDKINDQVIEIGITIVNTDGTCENISQFINPGKSIPENIVQLTGITDEMVAGAPSFKEFSKELYDYLIKGDLAGFNIKGFDIPFLCEKFSNLGLVFPLPDQKIIDVSVIYKKFFPRDLTAAVKDYLGVEMEGAHRAVNDTMNTFSVFTMQIQKHFQNSSLEEISKVTFDNKPYVDVDSKLTKNENGEIIYNFGKHIGKTIKQEPGFANWMLDQPFINSQTKQIVKRELDSIYNRKIQGNSKLEL